MIKIAKSSARTSTGKVSRVKEGNLSPTQLEREGWSVLPGWDRLEPGFIACATRAISARVNENFDSWPSAELKSAYKTFLGKPVFVNHTNHDPKRARGVIIATRYVENGSDKYVECIQEVDAQAFPRLAKEIIEGNIDSVSMGASVELSECSYCGKTASAPDQFCEHIAFDKGRELVVYDDNGIRTSKLVHEICHKISFFELSLVFDGADTTAVFQNVYVATRNNKREAYQGLTSAPAAVDTLAGGEICPECGADDFGGGECRWCDFFEAPEEMQEPDLSKAKEYDRQGDEMARASARSERAARALAFNNLDPGTSTSTSRESREATPMRNQRQETYARMASRRNRFATDQGIHQVQEEAQVVQTPAFEAPVDTFDGERDGFEETDVQNLDGDFTTREEVTRPSQSADLGSAEFTARKRRAAAAIAQAKLNIAKYKKNAYGDDDLDFGDTDSDNLYENDYSSSSSDWSGVEPIAGDQIIKDGEPDGGTVIAVSGSTALVQWADGEQTSESLDDLRVASRRKRSAISDPQVGQKVDYAPNNKDTYYTYTIDKVNSDGTVNLKTEKGSVVPSVRNTRLVTPGSINLSRKTTGRRRVTATPYDEGFADANAGKPMKEDNEVSGWASADVNDYDKGYLDGKNGGGQKSSDWSGVEPVAGDRIIKDGEPDGGTVVQVSGSTALVQWADGEQTSESLTDLRVAKRRKRADSVGKPVDKVVTPDYRIDLQAPVDDRSEEGEETQFPESDFAQNAGDALANPEEDNALITMPGEKKQLGANFDRNSRPRVRKVRAADSDMPWETKDEDDDSEDKESSLGDPSADSDFLCRCGHPGGSHWMKQGECDQCDCQRFRADYDSKSARIKRASISQITRLVDLQLEAGIVTASNKYQVIAQFENLPEPVIKDRIAQAELWMNALKTKTVASSQRTASSRIASRAPSLAEAPAVSKRANIEAISDSLLWG